MSLWRRKVPLYDPTQSDVIPLPDQWLDASDTTTLDKAGPAPITNGATVLEWRTKSGTLRKYRLIGPNAAPTWDANVVGSLGGVRCFDQILSADVLTGMRGLSGRTILCAFKQIAATPGKGVGFSVTEPHVSGNANNPTQTVVASTSGIGGGSKRIQGETFTNSAVLCADNATVLPIANGQVFICGAAISYTERRQYYYGSGCEAPQLAEVMASAGVTNTTIDPYAMSVGSYLEEVGSLGPNTGSSGLCRGYVLEILDWFRLLTPDQLVGPHTYLRLKWGVN